MEAHEVVMALYIVGAAERSSRNTSAKFDPYGPAVGHGVRARTQLSVRLSVF